MMQKKQVSGAMPYVVFAVLLVLGILFCFQRALGEVAISCIVGASMIVLALVLLVHRMVKEKCIGMHAILTSCLLSAFGIVFILKNLTELFFWMIPWMFVFGGVYLVADAVMRKVFGNGRLAQIVLAIVIGVAVLVFGICILCIENLQTFVFILFGAVLIALAVYVLIDHIVKSVKKGDADR